MPAVLEEPASACGSAAGAWPAGAGAAAVLVWFGNAVPANQLAAWHPPWPSCRVLPLNRIAAAILALLRNIMEEEAGAADLAAAACCCPDTNGSAKAGSDWADGGEGGGAAPAAGDDGVQPMGGWGAAGAIP